MIAASLTARLLWPSVPLPEGQRRPSLGRMGAKTWLQRGLGCAVRLLMAGLLESPCAGGGRFAPQWGAGCRGSVSRWQGRGFSRLFFLKCIFREEPLSCSPQVKPHGLHSLLGRSATQPNYRRKEGFVPSHPASPSVTASLFNRSLAGDR